MDYYQEIFETKLRMEIKKEFPIISSPLNIRGFGPKSYEAFVTRSIEKNVDNSMVEDGIIYLETDKDGRAYYLDCSNGLIYYIQNGISYIAKYGNYSTHYDIFDAVYFRRFITDPSFRSSQLRINGNYAKEPSLLFMPSELKNLFSIPILEYTAKSISELKSIISEITGILSSSQYFKKLWFRGQRKEYFTFRSLNTLNKLGLSNEYGKMPSLEPSLARIISNENFADLIERIYCWANAFRVWVLAKSSKFEEFQFNGPLYNKIIKCVRPEEMAQFVYETLLDIDEYIFFKDELEEKAGTLALQQYGCPASMLDITDDIDVALFFAQSYLNKQTMKYELCGPKKGNIIYVFVQGSVTDTIDISSHAFAKAIYEGISDIPLRILNQKCGLLTGANIFGRNTYAYRIVARINLAGADILTTKKVADMFPDIDHDSLYKTYSLAEPKLNGLYG